MYPRCSKVSCKEYPKLVAGAGRMCNNIRGKGITVAEDRVGEEPVVQFTAEDEFGGWFWVADLPRLEEAF